MLSSKKQALRAMQAKYPQNMGGIPNNVRNFAHDKNEKQMKKNLFLAFSLAAALSAQARSLVITTGDGTKAYFPISDTERPVMEFANGTMRVSGKDFAFADVSDFRIADDEPTAISALPAFRRAGGAIVVESTAPMVVVTIDGKPVQADIQTVEGVQTVSTDKLRPGIYVVKAGQSTFKFVKR